MRMQRKLRLAQLRHAETFASCAGTARRHWQDDRAGTPVGGISGTVRGLFLGVCSLHAEGVLHGTQVGKDGPDDASVTGRCLPSAMQQLPEFTRG